MGVDHDLIYTSAHISGIKTLWFQPEKVPEVRKFFTKISAEVSEEKWYAFEQEKSLGRKT